MLLPNDAALQGGFEHYVKLLNITDLPNFHPRRYFLEVVSANYRTLTFSNQQLRNNLGQAEKIRERLVKENRELQEELKLREDSIFDQDDEIEKRNAELRSVKTNLDALQKEVRKLGAVTFTNHWLLFKTLNLTNILTQSILFLIYFLARTNQTRFVYHEAT